MGLLPTQFLVSIHAFRGEGDSRQRREQPAALPFQSTPSGGKATWSGANRAQTLRVSIHAFRGEGDRRDGWDRRIWHQVSIHAFRGEGD